MELMIIFETWYKVRRPSVKYLHNFLTSLCKVFDYFTVSDI